MTPYQFINSKSKSSHLVDPTLAKNGEFSAEAAFLSNALAAHYALFRSGIFIVLEALCVHSTLAFQVVELSAESTLLGSDGRLAVKAFRGVRLMVCRPTLHCYISGKKKTFRQAERRRHRKRVIAWQPMYPVGPIVDTAGIDTGGAYGQRKYPLVFMPTRSGQCQRSRHVLDSSFN